MKFNGLNTTRIYNVNVRKYLINWKKAPSQNQQVLQNYLRKFWETDVVLAEFVIPNSRLRIDILKKKKKVAIEFSPHSHHSNYNKFFHKHPSSFLKSIKRDCWKEEWIKKNSFLFLEMYDEDIPDNLTKKFFESKGIIL